MGRAMKIYFFGNFGSLNTGNESTLLAILTRLRCIFPQAEFCCICPHPEVVRERDKIDAIPITLRSVRIWDREVRIDKRLRNGLHWRKRGMQTVYPRS